MLMNWELIADGETLGFMLKCTTRNLRDYMLSHELSHVFVVERNSLDEVQSTFNATIRNRRIHTDR